MPLNLLDSATWQASTLYTAEGPITYWVLADWDASVAQFIEVMPHDLLRIAAERDPELEGARG